MTEHAKPLLIVHPSRYSEDVKWLSKQFGYEVMQDNSVPPNIAYLIDRPKIEQLLTEFREHNPFHRGRT